MAESVNTAIITNIKRLIDESGTSRNQTAIRAGMTPQRLSNLCNDRGLIHPDEIQALAIALGEPVAVLFEAEADASMSDDG